MQTVKSQLYASATHRANLKEKLGQTKAGANIFVEVTHVKAKETPHTFTRVNGNVVRKNEMRNCLDTPEPPVGTFGTPCKLLQERIFVHPENTREHEQWVAREARKSSKKRAEYKAKRGPKNKNGR